MKNLFTKTTLSIATAAVGLMVTTAAFAEQSKYVTFDQLNWEPQVPGIDIAVLWGDYNGEDYGLLVRLKPGSSVPRHSHAFDYHGVTLQGNWIHSSKGHDNTSLTAGGYAFQAAKEVHTDRCTGTEDCILLIHQHGPRDFISE